MEINLREEKGDISAASFRGGRAMLRVEVL